MKKGLLILGNKKYVNEFTIYDTIKQENKISLIYSNIQKTWTYPGKKAYTLKCTGNGFELLDHTLKETIRIDYCQAQALRALLKIEDNTGDTFKYMESK